MSKKDEALKKCLRVLEPIANERMYETQWVDSAIHAAYEALEEWQGLGDEEVNNIFVEYADLGGDVSLDKCLIAYRKAEQKLKENNS